MANSITDKETAESIAVEYAEKECIGTIGEVIDVVHEDAAWIVELQTHTFSEEFVHRIEITDSVGNVISHDRHVAPA